MSFFLFFFSFVDDSFSLVVRVGLFGARMEWADCVIVVDIINARK